MRNRSGSRALAGVVFGLLVGLGALAGSARAQGYHVYLNPVQPGARGRVPVAILGSDAFDVATIDRDTLRFGAGGAEPVHASGGHVEDVNGDGHPDLISHYSILDSGIGHGDSEACVSGEAQGGLPFEACDAIVTRSGSAGPRARRGGGLR